MSTIETTSVNAIRILAADAVQKANSGHPGLPLGAAPMAYELWTKHMNHNPENPNWVNRDRFILSGGHGSALLYSLLHLFGYGISVDDLKNFRQSGSLTPGHPEYGHTIGVEATTGPLGAGIGMAVGVAMAEAHLASKFNKEDFDVVDHYTFVLAGDGCMMEGISSEACSLAGTLGLGKLIILYDSNAISIEGSTDIAFNENVGKRFEAFGFQTIIVEDGNDLEAIGKAIEEAKSDLSRPSMITICTKIGYGCPAKEGKASAHGEPLGVDNVKALRETLNWSSEDAFVVSSEVYDQYKSYAKIGANKEETWNKMFESYCEKYADMKNLWDKYNDISIGETLFDNEEFWKYSDKADATRNISGNIIQKLKDVIPGFMGGSADLAPSTKTYMNNEGDFSKETPGGRNIHFGVRELAMAAIGNGLALHGGLRAYVSTFFVFSDYVKPMARLSSLMGLPVTYVFTHDSIGVGEDGPTHEPVEQLAMFRAMPNFVVYRPADAKETLAAWYHSVTNNDHPTALILTRQNVPLLEGSNREGALKGGYIIVDSKKDTPDGIILASGSEVSLAIEARKILLDDGVDVRVVSMPSMELFDEQSEEYKEMVMPKSVRARVALEAAAEFGWGKYVGLDGAYVTMKSFGASAPANELFEKFGFNVQNVVDTMKKII